MAEKRTTAITTFATIDGKLWHCGQMAHKLRHAHAAAATCIGLDAHSGISEMFQASGWRRAWLIDGELAALGGVVGPMLASDGFVWLALAEATGRYPIAIVREARRQLADLMMFKRCVTTTILPGDPASQRLAIFLGFHVCGELAQPPFPATTRLGRRTIARYIEGTPECRVPIRGGYGVQLIYHGAME